MRALPRSAYFIGIGGIGMSALARWFHKKGVAVSGYDRTATYLTTSLEEEGMDIHYADEPESIPESFLNLDKEATLLVYTPAIPANHKEFNFLINKGYKPRKRSEVLADITEDSFTIAIAGTHGKTTVTSMVAHLLSKSGLGFSAFVGGLMKGFESNFIQGSITNEANEIIVVEADEFDRSFHRLNPDLAIITSVESDHLDIYESREKVVEAFKAFAQNVKPEGHLLVQNKFADHFDNALTYGEKVGDFSYQYHLNMEDHSRIDLKTPKENYSNIEVSVGEPHNVENAVAALSAGNILGLNESVILNALKDYKGVKRRFELIYESDQIVYIDDYAHHPTEIWACIDAAKRKYPDKEIYGFFQPHLFTRTRDFLDGFASALDAIEHPYLLEIYPAREEAIPGVSSQKVVEAMDNLEAEVLTNEGVLEKVLEIENGVILTMGAGDIDNLVNPISNLLIQHSNEA